MMNDGNGTCYDKTTYQSFMTQHESGYVMQLKEGGSAVDAETITDCTSLLKSNDAVKANYQELKNEGGYAAKDDSGGGGGASGLHQSKLMILEIVIMNIVYAFMF